MKRLLEDKKGGFQLGMILLLVFFIFMITSFATIEPFKETLDVVRSGDNLNCKGVNDFNQTAFDEQTDREKLSKRPTCFVTGMTMSLFIIIFLISAAAWVLDNWRKK